MIIGLCGYSDMDVMDVILPWITRVFFEFLEVKLDFNAKDDKLQVK